MKNDSVIKSILDEYFYEPHTGYVFRVSTGNKIASTKNGYPVIQRHGKSLAQHRLIMFKMGIDIPDNHDVDHINGVRDDNRWFNLRVTSRSINRRNTAVSTNNSSGIAGIYWHKHQKAWHIRVCTKHVGYSRDFFEACCMRKTAELVYGNFTDRHGK